MLLTRRKANNHIQIIARPVFIKHIVYIYKFEGTHLRKVVNSACFCVFCIKVVLLKKNSIQQHLFPEFDLSGYQPVLSNRYGVPSCGIVKPLAGIIANYIYIINVKLLVLRSITGLINVNLNSHRSILRKTVHIKGYIFPVKRKIPAVTQYPL